MKYIDPTSGEKYGGIESAKAGFCTERKSNCRGCPLSVTQNKSLVGCRIFSKAYPDKAAELMGLEVIKEDEAEA